MKDYKKLSESTFNIQAETYDTDKNGKHARTIKSRNTQWHLMYSIGHLSHKKWKSNYQFVIILKGRR